MISVKGRFDGKSIILDNTPVTHKCEVIVTFMDTPISANLADADSLSYLFKDYVDDGIREPLIDFIESLST